MPRCSASGCRNMGSHTFPKDPNLRIVWEKATNKENFKASKHSRLCYDHFKPSDYVDVCMSTGTSPFNRYLKKTAVPSIFSSAIQKPRTSGASEIKAKTASRPQINRYLKKGVVPSIFPWSKKRKTSETELDLEQQDKASYAPTKNIVVKSNTVSPEIKPKKEECNSSENKDVIRNRSVRLRNRKAYLLNRRCSVPHCNVRPTNEISLHPCPNNAAVRNEWAEALRVSYQYVKNMVACSLHFTKLDFIQSRSKERVLKYNAVPSRNLISRKKAILPVKQKLVKKEASSKTFEKQQTMTDTVDRTKEATQEEAIRECRACLKKLDDKKSCCNVFQAWAPPWEGMEATIAEDLAKLANIEISPTDRHSKVLCAPCYQRLLESATFAAKVRDSDLLLRMRFTADIDMDKVWPKPIQVDKNINGSVFNNTLDVEIKKEVLSDEEYPVNSTDNGDSPYVQAELGNLDIKIEPEEFVEPPPMNITINGTISLDPLNSENKDLANGTEAEVQQATQFIQMEVKQEPSSEGEQDIEQTPDLPLECLLCTKSFNSVTGLKAHVIAQHSYQTVKRKANGSMSPEKKRCSLYRCEICKRSFQTSTDLMVHETCHNKHACYGCTAKFDSFELLTRHRKRCKASLGNSVQKLKTLEDVKRPLPEEKVSYLKLEIEKVESKTTWKDDDIEMKVLDPIEDVEMKDIKSEQKEEHSKENQVGRDDEKVENEKKLDSVNEEAEIENKAESAIEEVNQQLQSTVEESAIEEVDHHLQSILEESAVEAVDNRLQSAIEENTNLERIGEEFEKDKELERSIEAVDSRLESAIEEDTNIESVREEFENDKEIESVVETVDNKLESAVEEVENRLESDTTVESVIEATENKFIETASEELGSKLESVFEEVESVIRKPESENEDLQSEAKKIESEKEILLEDPDTNMKIHLEIHSTENETEPALSDAEIQLETLENDD